MFVNEDKKEQKQVLKCNDNISTTYQNLYDTMKAFFIEKFIVVNDHIRKFTVPYLK